MRKDKGLNGDLDRLPMLTWIKFLKFLDVTQEIREQKAALAGEKFRPADSWEWSAWRRFISPLNPRIFRPWFWRPTSCAAT